jgi:sugar fermentation stimulation protein A
MNFPTPLESGILLKRYKRFLADIKMDDNREITVHCPNSGSMRSCSTPGSKVQISRSLNPKRKYPFTLEMIRENSTWIGINTSLTNDLVVEGINNGTIVELQNPDSIQREIRTSAYSRLDIMLKKGPQKIYLEVKSCTLVVDRCAMFPDAVTSRGTRHLKELVNLVRQGEQGIIFFLVQRMDADCFRPATHIDPLYANTLKQVHNQGVQILVYQAEVTPGEIRIVNSLPFLA